MYRFTRTYTCTDMHANPHVHAQIRMYSYILYEGDGSRRNRDVFGAPLLVFSSCQDDRRQYKPLKMTGSRSCCSTSNSSGNSSGNSPGNSSSSNSDGNSSGSRCEVGDDVLWNNFCVLNISTIDKTEEM
eukprot:GHVS01051485.1.p2 GENE.GHVS01051485.1~~GHVS01051485.1.p2  ORF type:complete len:129 (-),score=17.32 GHVS01051485.1:259-645(-)